MLLFTIINDIMLFKIFFLQKFDNRKNANNKFQKYTSII